MRDLPPGLQAHLDSGATTLCWCWRLTPLGRTALGFTDHDRDVAFAGTRFRAATGFTPSEIRESTGLAPANLEVEAAFSAATLTEADLEAGVYDAAEVEIWRVNWAEPAQRVLLRKGAIGEVRRAAGKFIAEIRGLAHLLEQQEGRLYQYTCDARLGDERCRAVPQARHALVVAADGQRAFTASIALADGWLDDGALVWTSGANGGRRSQVKRQTGAEVTLWHPASAPILPGDACTLTPGCDKTFATCGAKFANALNFRGHPHMPGNAYVTQVAAPGSGPHDGSPQR